MVRRAWRRLLATPIFTVFAVASLSLGVGVTTAIYSVVSYVANPATDWPNSDRIAVVSGTMRYVSRPGWRSVLARRDFEDLRASSATFSRAVGSAAFTQTLVDGSISEVVVGEAVSGNYFDLFGLVPERGRLIQEADDRSPSRIAAISHLLWRTRFGSDPGLVGRSVRIGGQPFQIVGIVPDGFSGLNQQLQISTSVWVPLASTALFPSGAEAPRDPADRRRGQVTMLLPMPAGGSLDAVAAEARAVGARLDAALPIEFRQSDNSAPVRLDRLWSVRPLSDVRVESERQLSRAVIAVMAIVGLVLVVACTNLANLVLARGATRKHEMAVRRALGAPRLALVLDQLAETGLLAAMGGVGAYVVMRLLLVWFSSASLPIAQGFVLTLEPRVDVATLVLAAVALLASLLVFGVGPALQLTRAELREALATDGGSTGRPRWRTRRGLIAAQVAISFAFFLIAAFAVRIVLTERSRPSGVDVDRLALGMLTVHLPPWNEVRAREAVDRILLLPAVDSGLESVAVSSGMPFGTNYTPIASVTQADKPFLPGKEGYPSALLLAATPSIFSTLGVSILHGRGFDATDIQGARSVAVISERTARQLFGTAEAVGRELLLRNEVRMADRSTVLTLSVVGVAGDTDTQHRYSRDLGIVYVPLSQHYEPTLVLVGRTAGDPMAAIPQLRTIVRRADADLVLDRPGSAAALLTGAYVLLDVVSNAAGGLAILAMLLAMAGLFGVLSHLVASRTREMGLRVALGAAPGRIRRLVLADGLAPVFGGLIVGLVIGILARAAMASAYGASFSTSDLIVFAVAPLPIVLSALVACYWPAQRASRVDPNVALRDL